LLLDIATASRDPSRFPNPEQIKTDRPQDLYLPFIDGPHSSLVKEMVMMGLVEQFRVLGRLQGLKKAPEKQGALKQDIAKNVDNFMSEPQGEKMFLLPTR
jgi:cytochrome P450